MYRSITLKMLTLGFALALGSIVPTKSDAATVTFSPSTYVAPTQSIGQFIEYLGVTTAELILDPGEFSASIGGVPAIQVEQGDHNPFTLALHSTSQPDGIHFFYLFDVNFGSLTPGHFETLYTFTFFWNAGAQQTTADIRLVGDVVSSVPLPAAFPLFASGAGLLGFLGWRRKKRMVNASA